jgi:hypothetical protein
VVGAEVVVDLQDWEPVADRVVGWQGSNAVVDLQGWEVVVGGRRWKIVVGERRSRAGVVVGGMSWRTVVGERRSRAGVGGRRWKPVDCEVVVGWWVWMR